MINHIFLCEMKIEFEGKAEAGRGRVRCSNAYNSFISSRVTLIARCKKCVYSVHCCVLTSRDVCRRAKAKAKLYTFIILLVLGEECGKQTECESVCDGMIRFVFSL